MIREPIGFDAYDGFGAGDFNQIAELNKALTMGYDNPPTSGVGYGDVLRPQSLESALKVVTYRMENIPLWKEIPKKPAFSTVEEYNLLKEYGGESGFFNGAGVIPNSEDATYERSNKQIKYMGVTKEVKHPATVVRTVPEDLIALETNNGIMWMLKMLEKALYFADSSINTYEFDGIKKQIIDGNGGIDACIRDGYVIDLRGNPLNQDIIELGCEQVVNNYDNPDVLWAAPRALADLGRQMFPKQRTMMNQTGDHIGFRFTKYTSQVSGDIRTMPDVWLRPEGTPPSSATNPSDTLSAPVSVTVTVENDSTTKFISSDYGTYLYKVTAITEKGESTATAGDAGAVISASGKRVKLAVVEPASWGSGVNKAYKVYRTSPNGTVEKFIFKAVRSGATTNILDLNYYMPDCTSAFMMPFREDIIAFKQLLPLIKIPLATVAPSIRWMQLLYGALFLYVPRKTVMFMNIGKLPL